MIVISLFIAALVGPPASLADVFPYAARTRAYSAWSAVQQSDLNTTGLAGAVAALPYSISSAENNPAGFAMETGTIAAQINRIAVSDQAIQSPHEPIDSSQLGFGVSPPPWGFAIAYYSPTTENATYVSPLTGHGNHTEVSVKEFRLVIARNFFDGKLAIGVGPELVKAVREIGPYSYDSYKPSVKVGALYRLPEHLMLGIGYSPPLTIGAADNPQNQNPPEMPGFNQAMLVPSQLDLGFGWIPNRFFKTAFQLSYVGDTANTALLSDQSISTGSTPTWVPRFGASYVVAEFANFKSEWAAGTYYEGNRFSNLPGREHFTGAIEANVYFANLGIGIDKARDFTNYSTELGIDVVRLARFLALIPKDPLRASNQFLPRITTVSADGLPDPMTEGEPRKTKNITVKDAAAIVEELPKNIVKKISGKPTTVELQSKKKTVAPD